MGSKVYRVNMKYHIKGCLETFDFVVYCRVKPDDSISQTIMSLKECLYYDWDDAPDIENVTYHEVKPT